LPDNGREFAARVVHSVRTHRADVVVETTELTIPGVSAYFRSPNESDPPIELIAWANWSYTLFYGKRLVAEDIPMDESPDDRVERVSAEILDLTRAGLPQVRTLLVRLGAEPGWAPLESP